ncbi:MAG TPA: transglutaminase family protein [Verrucomicrobiae bacterium]|jgi:transglutaminase-like putative cysteine protease
MSRARWQIKHRTAYTYGAPARDSFNDARLKPVSNARQTAESFCLTTTPAAAFHEYQDFYGNWIHHFEIPSLHSSLVIESQSVVEAHPPAPLPEDAATVPLAGMPELVKSSDYFDYLGGSRLVTVEPEIWRLALDATSGLSDTWQAAQALLRFTHGCLEYSPASTGVHTPLREALAKKRGVCQDFAHLMLGLCRALKIPASYVSGYLAVEKARATHAWVEVWIPTAGWLALDPTHNRQIDHTYIKIGNGRDYSDVPPVTGSYRGTVKHTMEIDVQIDAI